MSDEQKVPGFPLRLTTNARDGSRSFEDPEAYRDWVLKEQAEAEKWVLNVNQIPNQWLNEAINDVERFFPQAKAYADQAVSASRYRDSDPSRFKRECEGAASQLETHHNSFYASGRLFTTDSAEGRFLTKLAEKDRARSMGAFVSMRVPSNSSSGFSRGLTSGALFRLGIKGRAEAEGDALTSLATEWRDRFRDAEESRAEEYGEVLAANQKALASLQAEHSAFMAELEGNQQAQAERFHEIVQDAETDLGLLRETYRQQLGLSAPVSYWKQKADTHRSLGVGAFVLVVAAGGGFGWFFLQQVAAVLRPGVEAGTAEVVVLLTLATLGVWAVRIFVRLFFSQVHLNTDARERAVMIETFLALLTSEDAEKDERLLVLQTIFRPSSTGIVKDEAAPPSVASEISRILNR